MENQKKDGNLEDSARGQADPGSAAVYTMDRPGPVICMYMYVCAGTVSHPYGPTDPLVVALLTRSTKWASTCASQLVGIVHRSMYRAVA